MNKLLILAVIVGSFFAGNIATKAIIRSNQAKEIYHITHWPHPDKTYDLNIHCNNGHYAEVLHDGEDPNDAYISCVN